MSKSVFKQSGAKHYQLLHRSLRDPLINEQDSDRVLSEVTKGKQKASTSTAAAASSHDDAALDRVGTAALYDIHYDDSKYDYLQHLRPIGSSSSAAAATGEDDSQVMFIPSTSASSASAVNRQPLIKLPAESLPADEDQERPYAEMLGIPAHPYMMGLQPDMDPKLREVLEALEDEAYVENQEQDFFDSLVGSGEKAAEDEEEDDGEEWEEEDEFEAGVGGQYEQEMAKFKRPAVGAGDLSDSDLEDEDTEAGDTIADLRASNALRPPRKATRSLASGSAFSMSSSAMFRNEGLRTLDDRFDQVRGIDYASSKLAELGLNRLRKSTKTLKRKKRKTTTSQSTSQPIEPTSPTSLTIFFPASKF